MPLSCYEEKGPQKELLAPNPMKPSKPYGLKETCQTAFANVDRDGSGTIDMQARGRVISFSFRGSEFKEFRVLGFRSLASGFWVLGL